MTKPTIIELAKSRPVILDGAMTPVYQQMQFPETQHTGIWSLKYPERVQAVHRLYWESGADAVSTNTPPSNRIQLHSYGHNLEAQHDLINQRSVELATDICPPDKYVMGDIGPTGKLLAPYDELPVAAAKQAFADQAAIMIDGGVDFILFETFFNLIEAVAAVEGARDASKKMILAVTAPFQWHKKRQKWLTMMGVGISEYFKGVQKAGANLVGINCIPSKDVPKLATPVIETKTPPYISRPNAGRPNVDHGVIKHPISPSQFAQDQYQAFTKGIQILGGCCGVTPNHIQALRHQIIGDIAPPHSDAFRLPEKYQIKNLGKA